MTAPRSTPDRDEITVREAARRVGRTEETLRRWIWSGRLFARKRGNIYYLRVSDVDAAIGSGGRRPVERLSPVDALTEWLAAIDASRADSPRTAAERTAADLVLADREARSGDGRP